MAGHTASTVGPSALVRSLRPNYPYSIIAGGAYSAEELQFANSKDAVVRSHYSDFNTRHTQVLRLLDDRYQYVSYRVKDQVYWTKRKLRIPSGELILTDGVHYARARCGNRLSDQPHAAISSNEPSTALLSLPTANVDMLPSLALAEPPVPGGTIAAEPRDSRTTAVAPETLAPLTSAERPLIPLDSVWGGQPVVSPGGGFISPGLPAGRPQSPGTTAPNTPTDPILPQPPVTPSTPVPEPSTVCMFLITLLFVGWALLRMPREEDKPE
jgi:hypothetical protein